MRIYILALLACIICYSPIAVLAEEQTDDNGMPQFLNQFFEAKGRHLIQDRPDLLEPFYMETSASSRAALRQEMKRQRYLHAWVQKRNMKITDSRFEIRIVRTRSFEDLVHVVLVHRNRLDYVYVAKIIPAQWFGLGTRHVLTLQKNDSGWRVL